MAPGCGETGQGGGVVSETPILAAAAGTPCVPLFGGPLDGDTCWSGSDLAGAHEMRERSPIMPACIACARQGPDAMNQDMTLLRLVCREAHVAILWCNRKKGRI